MSTAEETSAYSADSDGLVSQSYPPQAVGHPAPAKP